MQETGNLKHYWSSAVKREFSSPLAYKKSSFDIKSYVFEYEKVQSENSFLKGLT